MDLRSLGVDPRTTCGDVKRREEKRREEKRREKKRKEKKSRGQIADMQEKIRDLQKMKKALMELTASCRGWGPTSECPILEMLASEDF